MLSLFDGCTIVSLIAFIFKILHFTTKVYIVTGLKKHNWAEGQQILKINTYMFSYTLLSNLFKFLFFRPIKTIEMKQDPHEGETSNYFEGQKQNKSGEFKPPSFNILSLSSKLYSVLVQIQVCLVVLNRMNVCAHVSDCTASVNVTCACLFTCIRLLRTDCGAPHMSCCVFVAVFSSPDVSPPTPHSSPAGSSGPAWPSHLWPQLGRASATSPGMHESNRLRRMERGMISSKMD